MSDLGLTEGEVAMLGSIFRLVPEIREVWLFGSRAKGTFRPESDVDLVLTGVDDALLAQAVAEALESLPLPYRFDVKALAAIRSVPLLEHIRRVGVPIFRREAQTASKEEGPLPPFPVPGNRVP
ncbi:MAG: nucleotidyltransferase domain-containing protein [Magnetococcales bacterium]|nr:nucleotidyltransferase domain-containing protein [Magnetococcales bacterium]MBF0156945.1 nucleotidyltransferase domain-containing protein [Magnetococcales bacterium]